VKIQGLTVMLLEIDTKTTKINKETVNYILYMREDNVDVKNAIIQDAM
jgi:hypothetical protein